MKLSSHISQIPCPPTAPPEPEYCALSASTAIADAWCVLTQCRSTAELSTDTPLYQLQSSRPEYQSCKGDRSLQHPLLRSQLTVAQSSHQTPLQTSCSCRLLSCIVPCHGLLHVRTSCCLFSKHRSRNNHSCRHCTRRRSILP
jgi:hypothetical protein